MSGLVHASVKKLLQTAAMLVVLGAVATAVYANCMFYTETTENGDVFVSCGSSAGNYALVCNGGSCQSCGSENAFCQLYVSDHCSAAEQTNPDCRAE